MNTTLTGWLDTDAVETVKCSQCGAEMHEECRTATGTPKDIVHPKRRDKFQRQIAPVGYREKTIEFDVSVY